MGVVSNRAAYDALNGSEELEQRSSSKRLAWVDGARGLGIAMLLVSHVLVVVGAEWFAPVHGTLWRPGAVMFLVVLGYLWRPGWRERHWQVLAAAIPAQAAASYLGLSEPNILLVILATVGLLHVAERWPQATLGLAAVQVVFWHPESWTGYPLGFALICAMAGRWLPVDSAVRGFGRLGCWLKLEVLGRRPLTFYLGHLLVLAAAVAVGWL